MARVAAEGSLVAVRRQRGRLRATERRTARSRREAASAAQQGPTEWTLPVRNAEGVNHRDLGSHLRSTDRPRSRGSASDRDRRGRARPDHRRWMRSRPRDSGPAGRPPAGSGRPPSGPDPPGGGDREARGHRAPDRRPPRTTGTPPPRAPFGAKPSTADALATSLRWLCEAQLPARIDLRVDRPGDGTGVRITAVVAPLATPPTKWRTHTALIVGGDRVMMTGGTSSPPDYLHPNSLDPVARICFGDGVLNRAEMLSEALAAPLDAELRLRFGVRGG